MITQGKLKKRLRRNRIIKRTVSTGLGVLMIAAVVSIPAFVSRNNKEVVSDIPVTETTEVTVEVAMSDTQLVESPITYTDIPASNSGVPTAGITSYIVDVLAFENRNVSVVDDPTDTVMASDEESTKTDFIQWAKDFTNWCSCNNQLDISYQHTFTMDGESVVLTSTSNQSDTDLNQIHVSGTYPNYELDLWYNTETKDYYVKANDSKWVHLDGESDYDTQKLLVSAASVSTAKETLNTLLQYILSEDTYTVYDGIKENNFLVTYSGGAGVYNDFEPTFSGTCDVYNWSVNLQKFDDRVDLTIDYTYTADSDIQSEQMVYSITPTNNLNLVCPHDIIEDASSDVDSVTKILKMIGD